MTVINAIILGLVQGIAEFLPISSSGHLAILNNLFGMTTTENGAAEACATHPCGSRSSRWRG